MELKLRLIKYFHFLFINKIFKFLILLINFLLFWKYYCLKKNLIEIENFTKLNFEGYLINSKSDFHKKNNPNISIVISVYNGEAYLLPVIRSVQNQLFLEIEIIIVDDCSRDKSIYLISELMKDDPRIILLRNLKNKGTLYTKTKGVLNSKGKYVMTLDQDNLYASKKAFFILYEEAEKNDLDLLGFSSLATTLNILNWKKKEYINYFDTPIIYKPFVKERFLYIKYIHNKKLQSVAWLFLYFIKNSLFKTVLHNLGDKFLNRNIEAYDDMIQMLLLSRSAKNLKHIKQIIHIFLTWPNQKSPKIEFQRKIKYKEREEKRCYSYLTYIYVSLLFTQNDELDKELASFNLLNLYLKGECRKDKKIFKEAIDICKLFLSNRYIKPEIKSQIKQFFNESKIQIINGTIK